MKHYLHRQFVSIVTLVRLLSTIRVRLAYGYWLVVEIGPSKPGSVLSKKISQGSSTMRSVEALSTGGLTKYSRQ